MTDKSLINPFKYYKHFIDNLQQIDRVKIVPLHELHTAQLDGTRIISLRHDIDSNPGGALRAARYLTRKGICGSFYLLPTAPYYGSFEKGEFIRNPLIEDLVLGLIVAGCEIGLHNDVYGAYTDHNFDGIKLFKQELSWLRSLGAVIRGTVAHNSIPVYGAENFEIFKKRVLWNRDVRSPSGQKLPIGKLSEKTLGLSYEGNFPIPKKNFSQDKARKFCTNINSVDIRYRPWVYQYLIDNPCYNRGIDYQFWLLGRDTWVAGGKYNNKEFFKWKIDSKSVLNIIQELPENTHSVLVIHPDYFKHESIKEPEIDKKMQKPLPFRIRNKIISYTKEVLRNIRRTTTKVVKKIRRTML